MPHFAYVNILRQHYTGDKPRQPAYEIKLMLCRVS